MRSFEQGQVLPLGLALLAFTMAGALMLFNTGQIATDKMRLANSADAAAYSGALWQARALNYQAYANRAMVANQVAIGQAVTLRSWMTYAKVTSEHIALALKPVPVINVVTTGIETAVALAEKGVSLGAIAMLTATNVATKALSASQTAMHTATLVNTPELIDVVASETDKRFATDSAYGVGNAAATAVQWVDFNTQYTKKDTQAMRERQQQIMDSRDKFTRDRNWDLFDYWVPSSFLSWHKLRRQGTTKLTAVKNANGLEWEWMAKDTLSIHNKVYGFFGSKKFEVPVAWGSAFANSKSASRPIIRQSCQPVMSFASQQKPCSSVRFTRNNHRAEKLADNNVRSLRSGSKTLKAMKGYGGVRSFWVLSDKARSAEDARLTVRVEVSLPSVKVKDSADIIQSAHLSSSVVTAGNTLSSVSAAEVYYRRPKHHVIAKSNREKANAYNPFWQARLIPVAQSEKLAALGLRSGGTGATSRKPRSERAGVLDNYSGQ